MNNEAIINLIDPSVLEFINRLTEPWKDDQDLQMFYEIFKGYRFQDGKLLFSLRIGSDRRINRLPKDENVPTLFYDEFNVHIRITSKWLYLRAAVFHNTVSRTEAFLYCFKLDREPELPEETFIFPGGNRRKPELFFDEIYLLRKQNREMRMYSKVESTNRVNDY